MYTTLYSRKIAKRKIIKIGEKSFSCDLNTKFFVSGVFFAAKESCSRACAVNPLKLPENMFHIYHVCEIVYFGYRRPTLAEFLSLYTCFLNTGYRKIFCLCRFLFSVFATCKSYFISEIRKKKENTMNCCYHNSPCGGGLSAEQRFSVSAVAQRCYMPRNRLIMNILASLPRFHILLAITFAFHGSHCLQKNVCSLFGVYYPAEAWNTKKYPKKKKLLATEKEFFLTNISLVPQFHGLNFNFIISLLAFRVGLLELEKHFFCVNVTICLYGICRFQ